MWTIYFPGAKQPAAQQENLGTSNPTTQKTEKKKKPLKGLPIIIWVFPKIVVPQNGWFMMEHPIKMGWFGGKTHYFRKPPFSLLRAARRRANLVVAPPNWQPSCARWREQPQNVWCPSSVDLAVPVLRRGTVQDVKAEGSNNISTTTF